LWVSEMIQDEKQQFPSGVLFVAVRVPVKLSEPRTRERVGSLKRAVEAA
jgi:hypothetical protein